MFDCDDFCLHVLASVDWFQLVIACVSLSCAGVAFCWSVLTCFVLSCCSAYLLHLVYLWLLLLACVDHCWFVFAGVCLCWL